VSESRNISADNFSFIHQALTARLENGSVSFMFDDAINGNGGQENSDGLVRLLTSANATADLNNFIHLIYLK
jgi:hypothetical protein